MSRQTREDEFSLPVRSLLKSPDGPQRGAPHVQDHSRQEKVRLLLNVEQNSACSEGKGVKYQTVVRAAQSPQSKELLFTPSLTAAPD